MSVLLTFHLFFKLLLALYLCSMFVQTLCLFLYRSRVFPGPVICGRFVLGGTRACSRPPGTARISWRFLWTSVWPSLLLSQWRWLWGPLPLCSACVLLNAPLFTRHHLAAFSCISRFGFLLTPSFNGNGPHTSAFLFFLIACAQLHTKKREMITYVPHHPANWLHWNTESASQFGRMPALCSEIASCHKTQEMMQSVYDPLAQGNGRVSYMFPAFRWENQGVRGDVPTPYLISVLESFLASASSKNWTSVTRDEWCSGKEARPPESTGVGC